MTCGIPTPPAELRLNAVLSRREPGTTPGIVPLPGMRAKDDAEGSRNATPSELAAKEMPPGPENRGGPPLRADGQRGHPGRPALSAQHCQRHRRTANPRDGGNGAFAAAQPGDQVTLTVARGIEHLTVKVRLGELPGS